MTVLEQAEAIRKAMDAAGTILTDEQAVKCKAIYKQWSDLVKISATVDMGYRFLHGEDLFKTEQPKYTFVKHEVPGSVGTESLFSRMDESHAGTINDPIPYNGNMVLEAGKYYTQNGVVYRCTRDTINPVYHALSDLVGLYVEQV